VTALQPQGKPIESSREAIDVGYEAGAELRKNGARPEHLGDNIGIYGAHHARSPFYADWVKGFHAGHSGERKPVA
jgi:hypothetical protein